MAGTPLSDEYTQFDGGWFYRNSSIWGWDVVVVVFKNFTWTLSGIHLEVTVHLLFGYLSLDKLAYKIK